MTLDEFLFERAAFHFPPNCFNPLCNDKASMRLGRCRLPSICRQCWEHNMDIHGESKYVEEGKRWLGDLFGYIPYEPGTLGYLYGRRKNTRR